MMSKFSAFIKLYRWPLISGVLIGTSYPPFPAWAVFFCYVPLWYFCLEPSTPQKSLKQIFIGAWVTQFILSLIGFHWIAYVSHEFGYLPWFVSFLVLLIFCTFVHLYIPLLTLFIVALGRWQRLHWIVLALLLALGTSLAERLWPSIFPWNLGYTLYYSKLPAYQWADIFGFLGLSTLVLLINAWVLIWWKTKRPLWHIVLLIFFVASLNVLGYFHGWRWSQTDAEIKPLIVQANIGNMEKVQAEKGAGFQMSIIEKFLEMSRQGILDNPDANLLIWPETAFPDYLDPEHLKSEHQQILIRGLREIRIPLVTGTYSKKIEADGNAIVYNAVAFLDENGVPSAPVYRKTQLLAYGEYLPLSETFPSILKLVPNVSNFGRGTGPQSYRVHLKTGPLLVGPQICYEGLDPDFSRQLALSGAQILINVTNDSWFGKPFEPRQHMIMTFARAIENRRPLVRATNTGISSAALASGQILEDSPIHSEWAGAPTVPYLKNPPLTFFSKWGHLDFAFVSLLFVLVGLVGRLQRKRN